MKRKMKKISSEILNGRTIDIYENDIKFRKPTAKGSRIILSNKDKKRSKRKKATLTNWENL